MEEETQQNLEKINGIKNRFQMILEDFKKYYVYYNKNPEVDEFQRNFFQSKSQLQNTIKEINDLSQKIKKEIKQTDIELSIISKKIEQEKILNNKLNGIVGNLKSTNNSSQALIDNSKEEYNDQYIKNWEIILGLFLITSVLSYRFESRDFIVRCMAYVKSKVTSPTATL